MPVLKTVGKNLFNLENSKMNEKSSYDMTFNAYGYWTYIVKLKPNTTYTISRKNTDGYGKGLICRINTKFDYNDASWYVADHSQNENRQQKTVTTGSDGYLYFFVNNNLEQINNLLILCDYIQIEEGSTATPYEAFKSNILTVNEDVVLRGIGDVRDELDLLTSEVTERIGEVVLDGSSDEEYIQSVLSFNNTIAFGIVLYDIKPEGASINNKFITSAANDNSNYEHSYSSTYKNKNLVWFFINKGKLSSFDVSGFRQWLSQNPITVQYQLATESIKTVDLTPLNKPYEGVNHYHLTSNIPCEAILEVPVVSTGKQTLVEINN